ncbi:hypothetical protein, partial [uncultured Enterobacter sp.]|uniref:hypothetical protein n=1 Tax=uncultured Enterobacter sp. TaxID=238202 RepID=UPI002595FFB1
ASLRLAPACRKRLSDLQPDQGIAECSQSFLEQRYHLWLKNYWGTLSPQGKGTNTKNGNLCCRFAFT